MTETKAWLALAPEAREASIPDRNLTRAESETINGLIFSTLAGEARTARERELARVDASKDPQKAPKPPVMLGAIKIGDKEMKLLERTFGDAPEGGRSLWISLHGGGEAPARVNTQQWMNQIRLYEPAEGVYVAPRAPTDKWNMWHQDHIDDFLDRLIENHIIASGVNPDRVYLFGYSAGGDGVYQVAPRMADRFAAASMMAGHPNEAQPLGLRNLPFMIWCGEKDAAHKRNTVAAEWGRKLDDLANADPGAYVHETHIVEGKGHWMDRLDAAALPWMQKHTRNPWPTTVVWFQDDRTHTRFYWLEVPDDQARKGSTLRASVTGQRIKIESADVSTVTLRLSDKLVNLDKPVTVEFNGVIVFEGKIERSVGAIWRSLRDRLDPASAACAEIKVVAKPGA
jgi:predicted esterase